MRPMLVKLHRVLPMKNLSVFSLFLMTCAAPLGGCFGAGSNDPTTNTSNDTAAAAGMNAGASADPFTLSTTKSLMTNTQLLTLLAPGATTQATGAMTVNVRDRTCTTSTGCTGWAPGGALLLAEEAQTGGSDNGHTQWRGADLFIQASTPGTTSIEATNNGPLIVNFTFQGPASQSIDPYVVGFPPGQQAGQLLTARFWCAISADGPSPIPITTSNAAVRCFTGDISFEQQGVNFENPYLGNEIELSAQIYEDGSFQLVSVLKGDPGYPATVPSNLTQIAIVGTLKGASASSANGG